MQDLIRRLPGVTSTRVDAIEIIFGPDQTDFRTLLEFFFQIHDPTTRNRQQRKVAEDTVADVDASGLWLARD